MSIQTENLKGIDQISVQDLLRPFEGINYDDPYRKELIKMVDSGDKEKEQMRDQIEMLEREVDRQSIIIDALVKAIKIIERG